MIARGSEEAGTGGHRRRRKAIRNWLIATGAVGALGAAALITAPNASAATVTWTTTGVSGSSSVYVSSHSVCKTGANYRFDDEEGARIETLYFDKADCTSEILKECVGYVPSSPGGAIPVFNVKTCTWM